jgi:hypothetical protein
VPPAVLQLDPQIAHVPVDHVALGHVVDTPQLVQNLIAGQQRLAPTLLFKITAAETCAQARKLRAACDI